MVTDMRRKVYAVSLIFFLFDLISKIIILNTSNSFQVIKNFFYIDKVTNTGAAFSIFSGATFAFIIIAVLVLIYINKSVISDMKTKLGFIGISMVIGGIFGNLFDRIFYGKVIDFLSFRFGLYYFPVFNLADTFICIGILFVIIDFIRGGKNANSSK